MRAAVAGWHWPLPHTSGVVLLVALAAGATVVMARAWLDPPGSAHALGPERLTTPVGRRTRPAAALVPILAVVAATDLARPDWGAVWTTAALIGAAGLLLWNAEPKDPLGRPVRDARDAWDSIGRTSWAVGSDLAVALVPVAAVALLVGAGILPSSPSSPAADGHGAGAGSAATSPGPVPPATGVSLTADVVALQQQDGPEVMFRARASANSYWEVAQLPVWADDGWQVDAATESILTSSAPGPKAQPSPATPRGTFRAQVAMADLSTRLLPVPLGTVSIQPAGTATVTALGVVAPRPTRSGDTYQATAAVAPSLAELSRGVSRPAPLDPATRAQTLAVPPVDPVVTALARQITRQATTPLGQAEALVDWFQSGSFTYTLDPPTAPAGTDPVAWFLQASRAGSCQTYATAYTVLARSLGLPTRVLVGFIGGTRGADGITTYHGSDAHAWPEVYLAGAGWVSFEPTPTGSGPPLTPADVVGPTGITVPTTAAPTTAVPTTRSGPGASSTPSTAPPTTAAPTPSPTTAAPATTVPVVVPAPLSEHGASGWPGWLLGLAAVVVVALAAGSAAWWWRGRAGRAGPTHRSAPPADPMVAAYRSATAGLAALGWARPAGQTPTAHARSLTEHVGAGAADPDGPTSDALDELAGAAASLATLAQLVEQSVYGGPRPTPEQVAWARSRSTELAATWARPAVGPLLIRSTGSTRTTRSTGSTGSGPVSSTRV